MAKKFYHLSEITFQPYPTIYNFIDLTDQLFYALRVIGYHGTIRGKSHWFCKCTCGNIISANSYELRSLNLQSCGCTKRQPPIIPQNQSQRPGCKSYESAKTRCTNPRSVCYASYGGRGIEFRFQSFDELVADIGERPHPTLSLDRIDNNGHYETGNVRWATIRQQMNNTRHNVRITVGNKTRTLVQWSRRTKIKPITIRKRMRLGWCSKCAVFNPLRHSCPHL